MRRCQTSPNEVWRAMAARLRPAVMTGGGPLAAAIRTLSRRCRVVEVRAPGSEGAQAVKLNDHGT
jgi:hypothetical protein